MKFIYQLAKPFCPFDEVSRAVFYNPPQRPWPPAIEYRKRILVEATPEQIAEGEKDADSKLAAR